MNTMDSLLYVACKYEELMESRFGSYWMIREVSKLATRKLFKDDERLVDNIE